jgi:uncharacterized membrane protein
LHFEINFDIEVDPGVEMLRDADDAVERIARAVASSSVRVGSWARTPMLVRSEGGASSTPTERSGPIAAADPRRRPSGSRRSPASGIERATGREKSLFLAAGLVFQQMVDLSSAYSYAFGALLLWGVWGIAANYSVERMDNMAVVFVTYAAGVIVVLALDPGVFGDVTFDAGFAFSAIAGISMTLGTVFFYRALELGQLSGVTAIPALYFVVAFVYGVIVLGEPTNTYQLTGVGLACLAVVLLMQ